MQEPQTEDAPRKEGRGRRRAGGEARGEGRRDWRARKRAYDERIAELEGRLEETQDKYLRTLADLDNFRKRVEREQAERVRNAGERLMAELLDVLDALDQALAVDAASDSTESFVEGLRLLRERFLGILEKEGLAEVRSVGEPFDPNVHEAVMQVESDEHASDTVVQELQKGYRLHERLLRPAKVTVAK